MQNCIFLLNAGHETTTSLVSNAVGMFIGYPETYRKLVESPELIDTAIEEILRFESPLQIGNRRTSREVTFSGVTLTEGTYIHTSIASANRDERQFENGDRIDLARTPNRHLAFITGIHVCLGATLARYEGRIALGKTGPTISRVFAPEILRRTNAVGEVSGIQFTAGKGLEPVRSGASRRLGDGIHSARHTFQCQQAHRRPCPAAVASAPYRAIVPCFQPISLSVPTMRNPQARCTRYRRLIGAVADHGDHLPKAKLLRRH